MQELQSEWHFPLEECFSPSLPRKSSAAPPCAFTLTRTYVCTYARVYTGMYVHT